MESATHPRQDQVCDQPFPLIIFTIEKLPGNYSLLTRKIPRESSRVSNTTPTKAIFNMELPIHFDAGCSVIAVFAKHFAMIIQDSKITYYNR